jgi:hypothetical protein
MFIQCRSVFGALTFGFLSAGLLSPAAGQSKPDDLLNKAKADQAVVQQRVETKLREALTEARRVQPTSSVRAVNTLKTALTQLDDPLIAASFRNEWTTVLNAQIRQIEAGKQLPPAEEINAAKREIKEAQARRAKAIQEEYNEVRRSLETIASLTKTGNADLAQREAEALAKRYPNNPAAMAMTDNLGMNQRLADARVLIDQQKEGYLLALRSVDKSAIPAKDDIEFDVKRWREITKLRSKSTLTKKEQTLMKSLDTPVNLGFKDAGFEEVIKAISTAMGQEILLDKNSLAQAMVDSTTQTSVSLRGVSARTALRKVLEDRGLTYIIKNESIQVITLERARQELVTRVYYLGDLVQGTGPYGGAVRWGPGIDILQTQENVNRLIEQIRSLDPQGWRDQGGNGMIIFNWPSMSLIVRQTAEFHAKFGGLPTQ